MQVVGLLGHSEHPGMAYHSRPEENGHIVVHGGQRHLKGQLVKPQCLS